MWWYSSQTFTQTVSVLPKLCLVIFCESLPLAGHSPARCSATLERIWAAPDLRVGDAQDVTGRALQWLELWIQHNWTHRGVFSPFHWTKHIPMKLWQREGDEMWIALLKGGLAAFFSGNSTVCFDNHGNKSLGCLFYQESLLLKNLWLFTENKVSVCR